MKARWMLVVSLVAATGLQGCTAGRRYMDKPWGKRTWIPAAICAAAGAGAGIGVKEAMRGRSNATIYDDKGQVVGYSHTRDKKNYWEGALVGAAAGALLCGLVGHYFEPGEEEAPPPPPPPPPPSEALPAPTSKRLVLRGVNFDFDKSDIRPDSRPVLDEAAQTLMANPQVRISVEGHTDDMGTEEYNEKLSVRRAEAVFRYLVNRGVVPERMEVVGYGESRPVADNSTESGRAENRRVELNVIKSNQENAPQGVEQAPPPADTAPAAAEQEAAPTAEEEAPQ